MLRVEQGLQVNVISYSGFEGKARGADLGFGGACAGLVFGAELGVWEGVDVCMGEYGVVDGEEDASELENRGCTDCCSLGVCWKSRAEKGICFCIGRMDLAAECSTTRLGVGGILSIEQNVNDFC